MKRGIVIGFGMLVVLATGIQFIRPDRANPAADPAADFISVMRPSPQVEEILRRSCYDCHSHQTRWPWYSSVAPVSWLIAGDVKDGREHLNLSVWGEFPRGRRIARLESMMAEVDKGSMPPAAYLFMHREAALGQAEQDVLLSWMESVSDSLMNQSE